MKISKAISLRILELCRENNISVNKLSVMSCLTQSTLQAVVDGTSKNPTTLTILRICDALKISLSDFFNSELFNNLDIEI